eukprot:s2813_g1.t1
MDWIATLPADDIAARVQLPPVLTPLRGVLERVLQRRTDSNDWAALVAVAEAMAALCSGSQLAHQADVVAIAAGGFDSPLLEGGQGHEEWETAVLLLRQLAGEIPNWPASRLPTVQEAAMQLVRGISSHIPEERWGQPGAEDTWWMSDRHHGLGDMALCNWCGGSPATSPKNAGDSQALKTHGGCLIDTTDSVIWLYTGGRPAHVKDTRGDKEAAQVTWGEYLMRAIDDVDSWQLTYTTESTREGPNTSNTKGKGMKHLHICPCRGTRSRLLRRLIP